jgi:arylsulfatase A
VIGERLLIPGLLLLCGCAVTSREAIRRPNIVILYTDDQGYGDCSALNPQARFATPNMDRIAREGLSFVDGHSAGAVCTPSRYALLTGRYAWRTESRGTIMGADADGLIEAGRTTIASLLRDRGYRTALFGKWHLGLQIPGTTGARDWSAAVTDGPLQKGFETFYGLPASMNFGCLTWFDGDRATAPATRWTRKKFPPAEITTQPLDYRMAPPYDEQRQTDRDVEVAPGFADVDALRIITERTIDYIEARAGVPFFVYVAFTSPHLPHCTAPEFRGTSEMGNYGDFMLETDHRVGQILETLDRLDLARDTLVILTSDNGPENNYKDWSRLYGHESNGGFRGGKRDVYEGGHRVPFLLRWPAVIDPGRTSSETVGQVDLLATIADVIGAPLEPGQAEDSCSFLPVLRGESIPDRWREPLMHHGRGQFAIRDGRWKLVFGRNSGDRGALGQAAELFDLAADPGEATSVLSDHPGIVEQLQRRAEQIVSGPPAGS